MNEPEQPLGDDKNKGGKEMSLEKFVSFFFFFDSYT